MIFLKKTLVTCLGMIFALNAWGQEVAPQTPGEEKLKAAAVALEAQLEEQLAELAELRATVSKEKPELATKMQETGAKLREKQRDFDIARSNREAVNAELEKAESQLTLWRNERQYLEGLLFDFRKNYEASASLAQVAADEDLLKRTATAEDDAGTVARLDLVEHAIAQLAKTNGPTIIEGKAMAENGELVEGTFAVAGPVTWFLSSEKTLAGLVDENRDLVPEVLPETASASKIESLIAGEKGAAPEFDPTLGTAIALEEVEESLVDHIKKGGVWIYPILFLALVALCAAIFKWIEIARLRDLKPAVVQNVIDAVKANDTKRAAEQVKGLAHPAADILRLGIEQHELPREELDERLFQRYTELLPNLQRGLAFIAIAAATAPLLGLLGTVTGMIHTFQKITVFGTGDAKPLASGISEALVTTEFGLIVAIPALIVHALLSRKASGIRSKMEMTSLAFVNGLK